MIERGIIARRAEDILAFLRLPARNLLRVSAALPSGLYAFTMTIKQANLEDGYAESAIVPLGCLEIR